MSFRTVNGSNYSENGWRLCNFDECTTLNIAGMKIPVRSGYAAEALSAWCWWYHENVERVDLYKPLDDWGWSRDNDVLGGWGQNMGSNHLSGTAIDLNATQYPWGLYRMPAGRIAKVREGLSLFEGIIFWGRDWNKPDEMHYQLNRGTASGNGASQRLVDFVQRRVRNGRLTGTAGGSGPSTPSYSQAVRDGFAQAGTRWGWI